MKFARVLPELLPLVFASALSGAVTVSLPLNPVSPYAGQTVQLNATGIAGVASNVTVTITLPLGNGSPVTFAATTVTPNVSTTTAATARKVIFILPSVLTTAEAISNASISISGATTAGAFTSNTASPFTISPLPLISNVSPAAGQTGTMIAVTAALAGTSWAMPASPAQISLIFTGPGSVWFYESATAFNTANQTISASVTIPGNASPGAYTVCAIPIGTATQSCPAGDPFETGGFTVVASTPYILSLSPGSAPVDTTASVTVAGLNLLGATFVFQSEISSASPPTVTVGGSTYTFPQPSVAVPGPVTAVSNNDATAVLSFPTGSSVGQFGLVASTSTGSSPLIAATQFVVRAAGPLTASSLPVSVLDTLITGPHYLPTGSNFVDALPVSVLDKSHNWTNTQYLPAGSTVVDALSVSVLDTNNNWSTAQYLPAGSNFVDALPASVLNSLWSLMNSPIPAGQFVFSALPVAVCNQPSGCPAGAQQQFTLARHPVVKAAVPARSAAPPRLDPVESLGTVIEGRTILLSAAGAEGASLVEYELNGVVVARTTSVPHQIEFTVPSGVAEITLRARFSYENGDSDASLLASIAVVPDDGEPVKMPVLSPGETATLAAHGWKAEFYAFTEPLAAMPDLTGRTPTRTTYATALNQPNPGAILGDDPLGAGLPHDFAAHYTGDIWIAAAGTYTFWMTARSIGALAIDGKKVVSCTFTAGAPDTNSVELHLTAGWHGIAVSYALAVGPESLLLEWQQPGGQRAVLGPAYVRTDLTGVAPSQVPARFDSVWVHVQQGDSAQDIPLRIKQ